MPELNQTEKQLLEALEEQNILLGSPLKYRNVSGDVSREAGLVKLKDYYEGKQFGEHFQYWRGRKPNSEDLTEIRKLATTDNQIGVSIERIVGGILGREPSWSLRTREVSTKMLEGDIDGPDRAVAESLAEITDKLNVWYKDVNGLEETKDALSAMLWGGLASLRLYIPDEYADELRQGSVNTLEEALELIHLHKVEPTNGGVLYDDHNRQIGYWYLYEEVIYDFNIGRDMTERHIELHTPQEVRLYRLMNGDLQRLAVNEEGLTSFPNPFFDETRKRSHRYLMHSLKRRQGTIISQSIIDMQDRLNVVLTNQARNDDLAGFRSVIFGNAEPYREVDEDGNEREVSFTPLGPDVQLYVVGTPIYEADLTTADNTPAIKGYANPSVTVIDPVDPNYFHSSADAYRLNIAKAFDQLHLNTSLLQISGESKRESKRAFDSRLVIESEQASLAISWLLESALRFAAWLMNTDELEGVPVNEILAETQPNLSVSRGDVELFKLQIEGYQAGLVTDEAAVQSNPAVKDKETELAALRASNRQGINQGSLPAVEEGDFDQEAGSVEI